MNVAEALAREGLVLVRELASGPSSFVYLVRDKEREVVAKLLNPSYLEDPTLLIQMREDFDRLASVKHPAIAEPIRAGLKGGRAFFVSDYVPGETLGHRMHRVGPLAQEVALHIAKQTLQALAAAHAVKVWHRDLKPSNIIDQPGDRVKIVDFALPRLSDLAVPGPGRRVLGTPAFMAPEQCQAKPTLDARSDLYSLGITLFFLTTGRIPFTSPNISLLLTRKITDQIPDAREFNEELDADFSFLLHHLCARDPDERPASAKDALALVEGLINQDDSLSLSTVVNLEPVASPEVDENVLKLADPVLREALADSAIEAQPVTLGPGQILFYEDDQSTECYVLVNGAVEVLVAGQWIATVNEAGSFLGEMSALRGVPRSGSVRAQEATTLVKLSRDAFFHLMDNHPSLSRRLAIVLAERLEQTSDRLAELEGRLFRLVNTMRSALPDLASATASS